MAGRQIRWRSAGRAAAIAVAVIAGIISLPALLGSDRPPPVPDDVGVAPPSADVGSVRAALPKPAPKADPGGTGALFRHIRKKSPRRPSSDGSKHRRSHEAPQRSHARRRHPDESHPAPSLPVPAAAVHSYTPQPSSDNLGIEGG
jgi:hypothetical protein